MSANPVMIQTSHGQVSPRLAGIVAARRPWRRTLGEVVKLDADGECRSCGSTLFAGTIAVYYGERGGLECSICARLMEAPQC